MQRRTGRASSMAVGLTMGALMSLTITIAGSAIIAKLTETEVIAENSIGYGVMIMLILASWAGSLLAFHRIKRQRVVVCAASGAIYFGVLLSITALFFGGQYSAVGVTALLVMCGSILVVLPGFREKRGGKTPKIKIPNR